MERLKKREGVEGKSFNGDPDSCHSGNIPESVILKGFPLYSYHYYARDLDFLKIMAKVITNSHQNISYVLKIFPLCRFKISKHFINNHVKYLIN